MTSSLRQIKTEIMQIFDAHYNKSLVYISIFEDFSYAFPKFRC